MSENQVGTSPAAPAVTPTHIPIATRLRGWVEDTFFVNGFNDSDSFLKNRLIDSTGMMELVAFVESEYGFRAADSDLVPDNLDSIDNLVRYIARKKG